MFESPRAEPLWGSSFAELQAGKRPLGSPLGRQDLSTRPCRVCDLRPFAASSFVVARVRGIPLGVLVGPSETGWT